jgi:hypothetical protein
MSPDISQELQFLNQKQYWMYGPCFQISFFSKNQRCAPASFEKALLSDPMVSALANPSFLMSTDMPSRCVLATGNGQKPLGFIYYGRDRGNYDCHHLATYPLQIKRHCGEFHWNGNADDLQSVIRLYTELIPFIRRLHSQLGFHLALVRDEGAPWFDPHHASLAGILIYDWLAQQGNFGSSEFVEYCYALLPFDQSQ